ncbi:MAG: peptidoglycan editing factor PgeF [Caryophanon sp.]|nr:peptidoglycan editing factor PgeF [Caryophanon sp.]
MNIKQYIHTASVVAGITLKDAAQREANNMALHVCEDEAAILHNRQQLAASLTSSLAQFVCAQQTHSSNFYKVERKDVGAGAMTMDDAIVDTDGLYTFEKDVVLCSFSADCVPVFLYDETRGMVGAIHSGWQGTVKEITKKMVEHLLHHEKLNAQNVHIHIGMALSQQRFEVDRDVYDKFAALGYADDFMYFNESTNKYHIDNQRTVKQQCIIAGIPAENITIDDTCTFNSAEGFSYRQDRQAGRHLSYIYRQ